MSIEIVGLVLNAECPIPASVKFTLVGLANHADPDGGRIFPGEARLARYVQCDVRTIRRHLRVLERAGLIEQVAPAEQHRPTEYRIRADILSGLVESGRTTVTLQTGHPVSSRPDTHVRRTVIEPSLEPSSSKNGNGRKPDPVWDGFVEWLGHGPETRSERGAWNSAAKELREIGVASADEVVTRGSAYVRRFPSVGPTPNGLVKHWSELNGHSPAQPRSRSPEELLAEMEG